MLAQMLGITLKCEHFNGGSNYRQSLLEGCWTLKQNYVHLAMFYKSAAVERKPYGAYELMQTGGK